METSTLILRSIVSETDAEAKAEAKEETHVEAVKDSKSMERAQAGHMRVKHLRGWVDKRRTASQRKSVEGVRFCIVFRVHRRMRPEVGLKGNRRDHRSCTLTTAQAMIQEQASCETEYWEPEGNEVARESERKGNGRRNILGK